MSQYEVVSEADIPGDAGDPLDELQSESAYSASEGSKRSSSESLRASSSRGGSKKLKIEEYSMFLQPRLKRLRGSYNDQYRELFNHIVNEITSRGPLESDLLPASQIGITSWSSEEKAQFFDILAKKGHCDHKRSANEFGSKSEFEVHLYLESLQKAVSDQHIYGPVKKLLRLSDLDAVVEISDNCCAALDRAAEALAGLQQKEEERIERLKNPGFPILTPKIARWVDRRLRTGEEGKDEVSKALPPATLLNLKRFLTVSKRFFMNSSIPENNWRTHTERRQSPTIMNTAFSDFHTLSVSLTRRIVQSCLFIALSRLRATTALGHYIPRRHVKRQDVIAALNVLGMKANGRNIWAGIARKHRLRVYDNVGYRQVLGKRYSYDEVEQILDYDDIKARGRSRAASLDESYRSISSEDDSNEPSPEDASSDPVSSDSPSPDDYGSSESSDDTDLPQPPSHRGDKHARNQERHEQAQDIYAEALDQQASRKEEQHLWELLGEDPAAKMNTEDVQLPKAPYPQRKDRDDLIDWRVWVDYAEEWETYGSPVPESGFAGNRKLGRERDRGAGLSGSDSSEERPGVGKVCW